jgi:uncharacterized membrane protein YeaQ/YmgE (transglycosylase-associated protein family)
MLSSSIVLLVLTELLVT